MPKQHPITSDALAIWRFDNASGDVPDLSGNGNTAVEFGTVPSQVGQFGTCRGRFTGSNYFRAVTSPYLKPSVFTYAFWIYWASSSQNVFAKPAGPEEFSGTLRNGSGQLNDTQNSQSPEQGLSFIIQASPGVTSGSVNLTPGPVSVGWHHIGITVDGSGLCRGYFDGQLVGSVQLSSTPPYFDNSGWWFGRDGNATPDQSFNGWLEDIAIYSEVKDICWFADIADGVLPVPVISNRIPEIGSSLNEQSQIISFDLSEPIQGVNLSTTTIHINNSLAFSSSRGLSGFTVEATEIPGGYHFDVESASPFEPGDQTVEVSAAVCPIGNGLDESYSFTTTVEPDISSENVLDEPTSGFDLLLDGARDISVDSADLELVTGVDEVVQHLGFGLRLYRGEWFLDSEAGIPYYAYVMVNNPNSRVIEGIFRQNILNDPDVEELSSFTMDIDRSARSLELEFTAKSSVGVVDLASVFP